MHDNLNHNDSKIYEEVFRDCLTRLLDFASSDPASEEFHLAKSLITLFPGCEISVVYSWWRSGEKKHHNKRGARTTDDFSVEKLSDFEVELIFKNKNLDSLKERQFRNTGTVKTYVSESSSLICIELVENGNRNKSNGEQLSIFLQRKLDGEQLKNLFVNRTKWLASYDRGLSELYLAIKALKNASHLTRIKQKFNGIQLRKQIPLSIRLKKVEHLVDEIIFSGSSLSRNQYLDILDKMANWLTQIVLGTGYSKTGDAVSNDGQIKEFFIKIVTAQKMLLTSNSDYSDYRDRLKFFKLVSIYTTKKDFLEIKSETLKLKPIYELLAIWSCAYQFCEQFSTDVRYRDIQGDGCYKEKWKELAKYSLPKLGELLAERYQGNLSPEWLHLWFCYKLLEQVESNEEWNKRPIHTTEKWRFRAKLSYIIREGLRFWEFGEELEYVFQPDVYAASLKTLVEHHAHWLVKLPRDYDLRILLTEIGSARDPDEFQYAIGHLHHALQIYIVGHFLCSLTINTSAINKDILKNLNGWQISEILASKSGLKPGQAITQEFKQAFSLAALYHDVGLLLFPRIFYHVSTLSQNDEDLNLSLANVHSEIGNSASNLIRKSAKELREAEYFDPLKESSLDEYVKQANKKGIAEHSVLGAWYLHRVCQEVDMGSREVARQAVRGVLLHNICTQTIDLELDPVAGLLVLCDEIFEWTPSLRSRSSYYGRLGGDIEAPNRPPQRSRAKLICLEGLEIKTHNSKLECNLKLSSEDHKNGWPGFKIELQHPDSLDTDTYQIWLSVAHNIGRLKSSSCGFGARLSIKSKIPGKLKKAELDTVVFLRGLAQVAKLPVRNRLESWLANKNRFKHTKESETVNIWCQDSCFKGVDINRLIEALKTEYVKLTQDIFN